MTTATYTVTGMTCGHCVGSVTEQVRDIAGVTAVAVDLPTGGLIVTSASPIPPAFVDAAVWKAGFTPAGVSTTLENEAIAASDGRELGSQIADGSTPTAGHGKPAGDPGASLLGLCLRCSALLLGIALLLARRDIRIPQWLLPTWTHPVFIGRVRDPPGLLQLCVIRC